jgi:hypothetical protein
VRYFRVLHDNTRFADRWFLDEPRAKTGEEIDAREFRYGRCYVGPPPVNVPIQVVGRKVAFNLAAFDMPVVTDEIARLVETSASGEGEYFPVKIGFSLSGYAILNAIFREACVDETRSEVERWKPEDDRPDRVGRYRMVYDLTIDPSRTHNRHIFRIEDFEVALIVSEKLKEALELIPDLGIVFQPVS